MNEYIVTHYSLPKSNILGGSLSSTRPNNNNEKDKNYRSFKSLQEAQDYYNSIVCIYSKEICTYKVLLKVVTENSFDELQDNETEIIDYLRNNL